MKISIASDHAGFDMKIIVKNFLISEGHEVEDFGTNSAESVDYSDFIYPAAAALSQGGVERAILIDGAGYPSAAIAALLPGVTPAVCFDTVCASLARQHSNSNALCLGGKLIGVLTGTEIVRVWLETGFLGGKYACRAEKVRKLKESLIRPATLLPRKVLTLQDVREAFDQRRSIVIDEKTIITPSVMDAIRNLR